MSSPRPNKPQTFLNVQDDGNSLFFPSPRVLRSLNQKQLQEFETDATLKTGHRPGRPRCPAEIRLWTSLWFAESVSVEHMKFCPRTRVGMTAKGLSCFLLF